MGKTIKDQKVIDYILSIKKSDITRELLMDLFAATDLKEAKVEPNSIFTLPANKLYNKTEVETTVGRYIFNLFILYPEIIKHTGYLNKVFDKDAMEDLNNEVANILKEKEVSGQENPFTKYFYEFIDNCHWLGYGQTHYLSQSISYDLYNPIDKVIKRRDELFEEHKERINKGDVTAAVSIENELVGMAKKHAKDTNMNGIDVYLSGAAKSFANNYKNSSIMRGSILDNATSSDYYISKSNLVDGIQKEEYAEYADLPVLGSYSRAIGTQQGGYQKKILESSFQTLQVDVKGTDCKSKTYLKYEVTSKNSSSILYRFIKEKDKLVQLVPENIKDYIGKTVELRSVLFCVSPEKFCYTCTGGIFDKLGITNAGLLTPRVGTRLLNANLKAFHDSTIKLKKLKLADYIVKH